MSVDGRPPLSASDDKDKVRAVLDSVSALTAEDALSLSADLADMPPEVSFGGIETSPDTVFFDPTGERFEAAATTFLTVKYRGRGKLSLTESFPAIVKGVITADNQARVEAITVEASELYEAG